MEFRLKNDMQICDPVKSERKNMSLLIKGGSVFTKDGFIKKDIGISEGRIVFDTGRGFDKIYNAEGQSIIPGLADAHVHLREPGFSYKETIRTGTMAAAHGGVTALLCMPNLDPAPCDLASLEKELELIKKDALVRVLPFGTISMGRKGRGELSDMEAMAPYVCGYSDDGTGVQEEGLMEEAMREAARLKKIISAHCEDEGELKPGGCIHDGEYARLHGHVGINSESEWKQVERDLKLAERTGAAYHVCHVSTKESVRLIREAKRRGVHVTCETGPHYLIYTDMDLQESGAWKMNPPIRSAEDRAELLLGIKDGTIDCIITDHAPHSAEEKSRGLDASAFGITGLETSFATVYTFLVRAGIIGFSDMMRLMSEAPRRIFGIPGPGAYLEDGDVADIAIVDLESHYRIDADGFYSMGHSTLFDGAEVYGEVKATFVGGKRVYPFD